ncbi:MAG: 16S rRNA (adenine(1518)-N(6)/adenine(1519)-N(6))-dimethyltransferase RsmA [Acidobacteriota bacterium]
MQPRAKKSLGQHFLADINYCKKIVAFAHVEPHETVVEIGPGTGQLTRILLQTARHVIAVEFDVEMLECLRQNLAPGLLSRLTLVQADVLQLDWEDILEDAPVKIVGNLPYNIATRLLSSMTRVTDRFDSFTFMVQKEVADRILAGPGNKDYGYFSLLMEYHFERLRGFNVPPGVFVPKPMVISHVMKLIPRVPEVEISDYDAFVRLLKRAFQHRRKTLWNNLKSRSDERRLEKALSACRVEPRARPEELSLQQYACLVRMLN